MYEVLVTSAELATVEGDAAQASAYTTQAAGLKTAANATLWNATAGGYRDNPTSSLIPQDGNSLSVWFGLVDDATKASTLLATLKSNWNAYGSQTPEGDPTKAMIPPFPGSMEVVARFIANDDQNALDLIRLEWGIHAELPERRRRNVLGGIPGPRQPRIRGCLHEPCAWVGDGADVCDDRMGARRGTRLRRRPDVSRDSPRGRFDHVEGMLQGGDRKDHSLFLTTTQPAATST